MVEINLLREEGWRYNYSHRFVWLREGYPWLALTVRTGELGAIFSSVIKAKGNDLRVYN